MQELTRSFVMLSHDERELVWGEDTPAKRVFEHIEAQIDVEWMSESRQGMYAFTAGGELLGHEVLRARYDDAMTRVEPVTALLEAARAGYDALDAERRTTLHPTAAEAVADSSDERVNRLTRSSRAPCRT
ncbi:hypothetical protein Pla163_24040 [Planctomycetes bacterium Pla163]|uniref:Uncharacterized protein n=1 Tax=Rohdeia mirabilis TaxID=2528008 RepID=A0A518D1B8_9BACT|nr:hypothetical protein Pla163_24040 [Planctomycetes bacterium Pla163]